jgi:hypothetical protein
MYPGTRFTVSVSFGYMGPPDTLDVAAYLADANGRTVTGNHVTVSVPAAHSSVPVQTSLVTQAQDIVCIDPGTYTLWVKVTAAGQLLAEKKVYGALQVIQPAVLELVTTFSAV